jgi:hypothetical protein
MAPQIPSRTQQKLKNLQQNASQKTFTIRNQQLQTTPNQKPE